MAAILVCGASVFTSCSSNDDNPVQSELNVGEKIIGKWISADGDGQPVVTNEKLVLDFVSTTKAYMSGSFNHIQAAGTAWVDKVEHNVTIDGNKVIITCHYDQTTTTEEIFTVTAIDDKEFTAILKFTLTVNGNAVYSKEYPVRYVKVDADYSGTIIGKWQGRCTSQGSVYDDGQEHQWEYRADGTYVYYCKNADGQWEPKESNFSQYFVAGNLLCTRWQNISESENREWWEITIENGVMKWTALRKREDGATYTATFEMTKVQDVWDDATKTLYVNSNPVKSAYEGRRDIVSVVFSDAVTSIGERAFYNCPISVVDLPASVVSIGSEAFAGEDSDLDKVTIYATDCTFGEHPFLQSIMTNIYVPAASLDAYEAKYPGYKSQIYAIPEAKQEGNEIVWNQDLCEYILVKIPYYHKDRIVAAHNTQGGITVTFTGTSEDSGFDIGCISLVQGEKLTFTSAVGNISKITIQAASYDDEDDEEDATPVAAGWTWDAAQHTFTWQGTPTDTVEMIAGGDVDLESVQIQFTIE